MPKSIPKSKTQIIECKKNQRTWIYEWIDPNTKRTIYVGRTIDLLRRGAEHDRKSSACKLLRLYCNLHNLKSNDCVRIVPELPNGVPASRASEFEAFFIIKRDTLYHPENRQDGCNQKHGDHVSALDYDKIKAEIIDGLDWEEVPADVIQARAKEALLETCVEEVGDFEPELSTALTTATMQRKQLERLYMAPVAIAEELAEEYESIPKYKEIDRSLFEADLNSLRDRLNAEDVIDDKMLSLVRGIALFGKSEGAEWCMRAHVAVHAFRMLAGALETREEARMPYTTAIRNMKLVRNWTANNDYKKPAANARQRKDGTGTSEEERMGIFLRSWKSFKGTQAYKQANKSESNFIMRHVSWWKEFANGSRVERAANLTAKVNSMLKQGYGHKDEPEFEGKKKWPSGTHGSETLNVYQKMIKMVNGHFSDSHVSEMLNGMHPSRSEWYKLKWSTNRPAYLANKKKSDSDAVARGYANGVKPKSSKKRKIDDEEEDEEDDDEDGNEDEEDDDDEDEDE
jgi:hypothetical protein